MGTTALQATLAASSPDEASRLALSANQLRAAALVAEGELTDTQIASQLGINPSTLVRLKRKPAFADKVLELVRAAEREIVYLPIARKTERTKARNDRWQKGQEVIRQRAEMHKDIPGGGSTGLLVRQVKLVKVLDERQGPEDGEEQPYAPTFTEVEEWAVDTALMKELSDLETAVERSLGQGQVVTSDDGAGGGVQRLYIGVQVNLV